MAERLGSEGDRGSFRIIRKPGPLVKDPPCLIDKTRVPPIAGEFSLGWHGWMHPDHVRRSDGLQAPYPRTPRDHCSRPGSNSRLATPVGEVGGSVVLSLASCDRDPDERRALRPRIPIDESLARYAGKPPGVVAQYVASGQQRQPTPTSSREASCTACSSDVCLVRKAAAWEGGGSGLVVERSTWGIASPVPARS